MADIKVTGSANVSPVTNGLKKIGQESRNVTKSSSQAGQAIFSLGAGIEDFAVAGMRGALNNIPMFIQQLGAGAGIAGAATIALVAVNELVKGIDRFMDARHKLKEDEAAKGFSFVNLELTEYQLDKVEKRARAVSESLIDIGGQVQRSENIRGLRGKSMESDSELSVARMIFQMEQAGASEEEKKLATLKEQERMLNVQKSLVADTLRDQQQAPKSIQDQIDQQQKAITKWKETEKAIADAYEKARREGGDKPVALTEQLYDPETGMTAGVAPRSNEDISRDRRRNIEASINAVTASLDKAALDKVQMEALAAEKVVTGLEAKKKLSEENLYIAEREASVATKDIENKRELLKLEEQRAKLARDNSYLSGIPILGDLANGGINKLLEAAEWDKKGVSHRAMNGGGMLSSSGRMGASGAEYNSAVATVNYQRESLAELKKIARNTSKGGKSTYN